MKKLLVLCFSTFALLFGMGGVKKAHVTYASEVNLTYVEDSKKEITRDASTPDEKYQNIINQMNSIIVATFDYELHNETAQKTKDAITGLTSLYDEAGDLLMECYNCYVETSEDRFMDLYDSVSEVCQYITTQINTTRENFINENYYKLCFNFNFLDGCIDQIKRTYEIEVAALQNNKDTTELIINTLSNMSKEIQNSVSLLGEDDRYTYLLSVISQEVQLATNLLGEINKAIAINELNNKTSELVEQYNKIKSLYGLDIDNSNQYIEQLNAILEKINLLKGEILAKIDEFGELEAFVEINESLTDLRVNCNDVIKDIEKNKIDIVLNLGATFEVRVNEIANNYKNNNLNYNGDIKECDDISNEIDLLIAEINEDSLLNSDNDVKELCLKLASYKETISQTKKNIEKDRKVFLALVIGCPSLFVVLVLLLLYFFGFKKRFLRKTAK